MHSCNDAVNDAKDAVKNAKDEYQNADESYGYAGQVLDGVKAATDDIDDKELRDGMMEFSTFINKEKMTLDDTIAECDTLISDCESKANAAAPDTLDYEVIGPIDEAKEVMMTCVKAMAEQTKVTKDIVASPEFAATLAVADLDLNAVMDM